MTTNEPDTEGAGERRSFSSRTPENNNPDKVAFRRGFVTRHQVSGWRFVMRRIASGIVLHDTRMLVDPLRTQSRAVLMSVLILITGVAGCFMFSLIQPGGSGGNDPVLADRSTSALYVRVGDELHPVLNLTSARLIVGRPVNPKTVKSSELDRFPRGNLIGIPGAPQRMVQSSSLDANWTVCDTVSGLAEGSHAAYSTGATVIAGPPVGGGTRAVSLGSSQAVLVGNGSSTWLLWGDRRSQINLADHAVTSALGLGLHSDVPAPRPIGPALLNAIPEGPSLAAPNIPGAGDPTDYGAPAPIGEVVASEALDKDSSGAVRYFAVLPDGLQPISPVLAAILRNTNAFGVDHPPLIHPDELAKLPVSRMLDTTRYPEEQVDLVDNAADPVICAYWSKPAGATTHSMSLLSGAALPIADSLRPLDLVSAGAQGDDVTAARVVLAPGTGYFTQTVGEGAASPGIGSLFWVSDTGVRYGIDDESAKAGPGREKTVAALGLNEPPVPIPWSVLSLFARGPTLSQSDALLAHDGLAPDARPGRTDSAQGVPR